MRTLLVLLVIIFLLMGCAFTAQPINAAEKKSDTFSSKPPMLPVYDSIAYTVDSLEVNGLVTTVQRTTDYYKNINGTVTIVKKVVCRDKCFECERTDCWVYELREGKLIGVDFIPGAE